MTAVSNSTHAASGLDASANTRGFANLTAGQVVNAKVLRKLDEQRYVVSLRGEVREAKAEKALPVGESIDVIVVSNVDGLQLRRMSSQQVPVASVDLSISALEDKTNLLDQAKFYKCEMTSSELRVLQKAMDVSDDAVGLMMSGFFLNKRGIAIEPQLLEQLHVLQKATTFSGDRDTPPAALRQTSIADLAQSLRWPVDPRTGEVVSLATVRQRDLSQPEAANNVSVESDVQINLTVPAHAETSGGSAEDQQGNRQPEAFALHQILNDVDANGLGVRYGTLPVLVNGELVELELVMFRHQQKQGDVEPIKRLVMSIHTQSMGTIAISAEALNQRLLVNISSSSVEHAETLGAYSEDVKQLAERFGWIVDSVAYEVRPHSKTLARRVMEHSVRQGVIDHVW